MQSIPTVREIMTETRYSVLPGAPAYEAVDLLVTRKLSGIPVIADSGALAGFVTEKDCLRLQAISHQYNMTGSTVRDIMSEIKNALRPDMDLLTASMGFLSCNFAALPVLEGEILVGSVTRQDMLQAIQNLHRQKGIAKQNGKAAQKIQDDPRSIFELQALVARSNREQLASVFGNRHGRG